jgi:hypothetical protein
MDKEEYSNSDKRTRNAIKMIVGSLYKLSSEIFQKVNEKFVIYKKERSIEEGKGILPDEAKVIVEDVFKENFQHIKTRSREIGIRAVRDAGVMSACKAWYFCRNYFAELKGTINSVPLIWDGVDHYFKRFSQMNAIEESRKAFEESKKESLEPIDTLLPGAEEPECVHKNTGVVEPKFN